MVQGRSTKIISMIQWIRTSRLSMKKSLCIQGGGGTSRSSHRGGAVSHGRGTPVPLGVADYAGLRKVV